MTFHSIFELPTNTHMQSPVTITHTEYAMMWLLIGIMSATIVALINSNINKNK